ncbi:MAG: glycosyltransferase family 39 protein [bacterium]|nr:glycosyltransferase family 39 protein [bacterium]
MIPPQHDTPDSDANPETPTPPEAEIPGDKPVSSPSTLQTPALQQGELFRRWNARQFGENLAEQERELADGAEFETNVQRDPERDFEDLTLAELTGQLRRAPFATMRALARVVTTPDYTGKPMALAIPAPVEPVIASEPRPQMPLDTTPAERAALKYGLMSAAFALAVVGSFILVSAPTRTEARQLLQGLPFLLAGFGLWLGAEAYGSWHNLRHWWQVQRKQKAERGSDPQITQVLWENWPRHRVVLIGIALVGAVVAWVGTANNRFTAVGFWAWVISILFICLAFVPAGCSPLVWMRMSGQHIRRFRIRDNWTLIVLILIMILSGFFRVYDLNVNPPEMTSDHKEKLLDAERVANGDRDVFFINNGGREPFQFYALAILSHLPGVELNFMLLKMLAVIESMVTIPVLYLLGREVIGERDRKTGDLVGLALAALVAVSYWHVAVTRLALRIVLTPLMASLLLLFLARGMRHNRRADFVFAGLTLGFGLYMYQAVRMLPVVVIVAGLVMLLMNNRRPVERGRIILNFSVLVLVSFIVFVPLFRFSVEFPEFFWMRTFGRLLGDDVIQETNAEGVIVYRNATVGERLQAFQENLPILTNNFRNALLMYNWKGDVAWINGYPNYPAMDAFTGSLLIIGLAAWLALIFRTRDPVFVLVPLMLLVMLLPSALSIAQPIENPSATRTSGSLPPAYLLAAFPLVLLATNTRRQLRGQGGLLAAGGFSAAVVLLALALNWRVYFGPFRESYINSSLPYSDAGQILRSFADEPNGAYGNAFMIAYDFWWDHTIVGMEAGLFHWQNGVVYRSDIPNEIDEAWRCRSADYLNALDSDSDLLFFYNLRDDETEALLRSWFPQGTVTVVTTYQPNDDFKTYRVPALGAAGLQDFLNTHRTRPGC